MEVILFTFLLPLGCTICWLIFDEIKNY
jgi:hypothetical protein